METFDLAMSMSVTIRSPFRTEDLDTIDTVPLSYIRNGQVIVSDELLPCEQSPSPFLT
jgi:hypothetical protein